MIPNIEKYLYFNKSRYALLEELVESYDIDKQVFGPMFDERVGERIDELCGKLQIIVGKERCRSIRDLNDIENGFEAISIKLLKHLSQIYLQNSFQEFSDCWNIVWCQETDKI